MRRWIKGLIAWTERKWPDKVVVSQKDYEDLQKRVKYLESEVTKFNASLGFAGGIRGKADLETMMGPFQR